jgi:threonine/homoserine/homoserine lactone efflux protein
MSSRTGERPLVWTWIWIVLAVTVNGLIFRWLGGFASAGTAMERWGNHTARRWARRRGLKGF